MQISTLQESYQIQITQILTDHKRTLKDMESQINQTKESHKDQAEVLRAEKEKLLKELLTVRSNLEQCKAREKSLELEKAQEAKLVEELSQANSYKLQLQSQLGVFQQRLGSLQTENKELTDQINRIQMNNQNLKDQLESLTQQINQKEKILKEIIDYCSKEIPVQDQTAPLDYDTLPSALEL